jgi:hypothetical protein
VAMPCRARRKMTYRGGPGKRGSYQEVQEDEAELVARSAGSRCCGGPAIPRRSFVWRQQDSDADALIILKKREGQNLVRELCEIEGEGVVQRREAGAYCKRRCSRLSVAVRRSLARAAWR